MTLAAAREKLHDFINHADEAKIFELLSLFEPNNKSGDIYDEATLNMLRQRSRDYLSGKSKTYSPEESMEHIRNHRKKNGIL
jgi:hypothetical protein